jgi:hypothetical protein
MLLHGRKTKYIYCDVKFDDGEDEEAGDEEHEDPSESIIISQRWSLAKGELENLT